MFRSTKDRTTTRHVIRPRGVIGASGLLELDYFAFEVKTRLFIRLSTLEDTLYTLSIHAHMAKQHVGLVLLDEGKVIWSHRHKFENTAESSTVTEQVILSLIKYIPEISTVLEGHLGDDPEQLVIEVQNHTIYNYLWFGTTSDRYRKSLKELMTGVFDSVPCLVWLDYVPRNFASRFRSYDKFSRDTEGDLESISSLIDDMEG